MTEDSQKTNKILIVTSIIGIVGSIIVTLITVMGNYNVEKFRQEAELTRMALVYIATQGGATQISMASTISAPTSTPIPTKIPNKILAPEKTSQYLDGVEVVYFDTFEDPFGPGWLFDDIGKIKDGVVEVVGDNWRGFLRTKDLTENQGFIMDFTYTKGSDFLMAISTGPWNTATHKQLRVLIMSNNETTIGQWEGNQYNEKGKFSGNLTLQPDKPYQLLTAILPNGEFLISIWDASETSKGIIYRENLGADWSGLPWKLSFQANSGMISFDNYKEILFDSAK